MKQMTSKKMVFMALFAAATTVATMILRIPISAKGYFNLGEIMIYTAALTFGPMVGGIAGGLGAALADLFAGYVPWIPITFVLKGIEGFVVGKYGRKKGVRGKITAMLLGGLVIVIGYPGVSALLYGWPSVLPELYADIIQVTVGIIVALPLSSTLRKIFDEEMINDESR